MPNCCCWLQRLSPAAATVRPTIHLLTCPLTHPPTCLPACLSVGEDLAAQVRQCLEARDMASLASLLPGEVVQQVALAVHHRLEPGTIVGLLQGTCCSEEGGAGGGEDITLYVRVAGALALRWAVGCGVWLRELT